MLEMFSIVERLSAWTECNLCPNMFMYSHLTAFILRPELSHLMQTQYDSGADDAVCSLEKLGISQNRKL